jgi:predicted DsbA family dithiol-disulfide isomerase
MLNVEIWSDVACPWCYVGKRRFESALAQFPHASDVAVTWRAFELDPGAPAETTGQVAQRLADKYGVSLEQAREMEANLTATAAADGLDYHLDIRRSANTFDAHRLVKLAQAHGRGDAMKERLMAAHFTEGQLVSDHETLVRLAAEVGLDPDGARALLASDRSAAEVRQDEQAAGRFGISGVPTFVVDRQIALSGAQPPDVLLALLQEGWKRQSAEPLAADV